MRILITGANGYIGRCLIPVLLDRGHEIIALVRNASKFQLPREDLETVQVFEGDLLKQETLSKLPSEIDVAYYLVHSMADSTSEFMTLEEQMALNFVEMARNHGVKQVIYLSGIAHGKKLSPHLASRKLTEEIICNSRVPYTILRAGIIIGAGSASFEIIRDLVEKLPIMIAPRWVINLCEYVSISDAIYYLIGVINRRECLNQVLDLAGTEPLTYREMMLRYAKVRGLRRWIINVPVLTPKLSSYWLYFVTSTNFSLAMTLVESLKSEVLRQNDTIESILPRQKMTYEEAVQSAFLPVTQKALLMEESFADLKRHASRVNVSQFGCVHDRRIVAINGSPESVIEKLWSIGGDNGWYAYDWAWRLRGWVDECVGGVGLRRGRTHPTELHEGDQLDFWRVVFADKSLGKLLLFAEMKVPGEAWLEFRIEDQKLIQTATFRPKGVLGRLYWYLLFPLHHFIFSRMAKQIAQGV